MTGLQLLLFLSYLGKTNWGGGKVPLTQIRANKQLFYLPRLQTIASFNGKY